MTYHRDRHLSWLAESDRIYNGAEIADALKSSNLKRREHGVQLLYELASSERKRIIYSPPKWFGDQPLYNALAYIWREEEKLLLEQEAMARRRVA
jgi:hypothetical protein